VVQLKAINTAEWPGMSGDRGSIDKFGTPQRYREETVTANASAEAKSDVTSP
jgi:hypothetical protein